MEMRLKELYDKHGATKRENEEREAASHRALLDGLNTWAESNLNRDPEQGDLSVGGWECKDSPIGVCFYDPEDDPCLDHCLVCGGPDERK